MHSDYTLDSHRYTATLSTLSGTSAQIPYAVTVYTGTWSFEDVPIIIYVTFTRLPTNSPCAQRTHGLLLLLDGHVVASGHYMGSDRGDALVQVSEQGGVEGYSRQ